MEIATMIRTAFLVASVLIAPRLASAQGSAAVRDELMGHFQSSIGKVIALADAMPAESYSWKPSADAMPVGHVYAHIAHYNFMYPASNMGIAAPGAIKLDTIEAMRDKAQIIALLRQSAEHVRRSLSAMPAAELDRSTTLYGRSVPKWAVIMQLVTHMNEHLGQSIAYARSNNIVPPWSR
jgi:uncharacterized damage-inducible protein DinB